MSTKKRQNTGRTERLNARLNPDERLNLDLARAGLSIADFVALCSSMAFREAVKAAGWRSIPEFLEAVKNEKAKIPSCEIDT